ncbi:MAG: aminotransferase class IV [Acidobacteriota bacterium]
MHRFLLHNDEIRDHTELSISPGQVGFLTGWGVFSTIRVYEGVMFAWERHFARMRHDAQKMRVPFPQDPAWLEEKLYRLIRANGANNATLRVNIVRNHGGLFEGSGKMPDFEVVAFTANVYQWGDSVRLGVIPHGRHAANEFAGVKYTSWSQNLTWYERAHEQGLDEVVLLNERGEVSECTSANIFVAHGNQVFTPPLDSGCLPGVTRAVLIEEIRPAGGLQVSERVLMPSDLEAADEVFITSTTRELLPVVAVEGLKIRGGRARCDELVLELKQYVRSYLCSRSSSVPI